jgi:hypothetical protein
MRLVWAVAVVALLALVAEAQADTVYLKGGQSVWGKEVTEEGDAVIVVRPGETLRFPKGDVSRIERWRQSVPRYYEPPSAVSGANREGSAPVRPATAAETSATESTAPASQAPPPGATTGPLTPTVLPPPPPPGTYRPQ